MKHILSCVNIVLLTLSFAITVHAQKSDSFRMSPDIIISTEGDTLFVIHSDEHDSDRRMRHINVEREIVINANGDTTIVTNIERSARMGERRHNSRKRIHHRDRHRVGERRQMRHRHRSDHQRSEESRLLRQMEAEARNLARKARQADEEDYPEKERLLLEQLEKIFDFKHNMKSHALSQRESDVKIQTRTLEQRQKNKAIIIDDRLNQLLGRGSSYNW